MRAATVVVSTLYLGSSGTFLPVSSKENPMATVTYDNVTLTYPDGASRLVAVDGVSLTARPGTVTGTTEHDASTPPLP